MLVMFAISVGAQVQQLDDYVREGLKTNLVLQQKDIAVDQAMLSLRMAEGLFMPSVSLQGSYTDGRGGRNIAIPIGDLLNPVYTSLNQMTGSDAFPQVQNVSQDFFPNNLYDAKVHTTLPLVNTDLIYNRKIQQQQTILASLDRDVYKRELVKNIKVAYYQYRSALEAVQIYSSALVRAEEGKRVNESLLKHGGGLPAYVLRSQAEVDLIQAQLNEAEKQAEQARYYFNFLLNRDLHADVVIFKLHVPTAPQPNAADGRQREERRQVREAISLQQLVVRKDKNFWTPRLNAFADVGSQYPDWKFNSQSRYYLVGVQLEIPLFNGFQNTSRVRHTQLNLRQAELQAALVNQQLDLAAQVSGNAVTTAFHNYQSALRQREAAASYQRLIDRGYQEGTHTFIEAVDARHQLTQAQLQVSLQEYRVHMALAQQERETASYTLAD